MAGENDVLVVAEAADSSLAPISAELLTIGRSLADQAGGKLGAVLIGSGVSGLAAELGRLGAEFAYVADDPTLEKYEGGVHAGVVEQAVRQVNPAILLLGQTPDGRDLAARVAFRLQSGLATDCTGLRLDEGRLVMTKPVYGGSAMAEYVCPAD